MEKWEWRTTEKWQVDASRYQNAQNKKAEASSYDTTRVCYSELLQMLYYEPSHFLIVNSIYNLFLGLIKEHFQGILGFWPQKANKAQWNVRPPAVLVEILEDPQNHLPVMALLFSSHVFCFVFIRHANWLPKLQELHCMDSHKYRRSSTVQ